MDPCGDGKFVCRGLPLQVLLSSFHQLPTPIQLVNDVAALLHPTLKVLLKAAFALLWAAAPAQRSSNPMAFVDGSCRVCSRVTRHASRRWSSIGFSKALGRRSL